MTLPADMDLDNDGAKPPALVPTGATGGVDPFVAAAATQAEKRSFGSRLLDYSAHAAMIVGFLGFAWTVSNLLEKRPPAPTEAVHAAAVGSGSAEDR